MSPSTTSKVTTNHDEIRGWAEDRGARPAAVGSAQEGGDPGIIRLEFPAVLNSNDDTLEQISWEEWFAKFDENGLAFLYQEHTADGEKSNFNNLISRDTAEEVTRAVGGKGRSASHKQASTSGTKASVSRSHARPREQRREEATRKSTAARKAAASSSRASRRSRLAEKSVSSLKRAAADRSDQSRSSGTTGRTTGRHSSPLSSAASVSSAQTSRHGGGKSR